MAQVTFVQHTHTSPGRDFISYTFAVKTEAGTAFDLRVDVSRALCYQISKSKMVPPKPEYIVACLVVIKPRTLARQDNQLFTQLTEKDLNTNLLPNPSPVGGFSFDTANDDKGLEALIKAAQASPKRPPGAQGQGSPGISGPSKT